MCTICATGSFWERTSGKLWRAPVALSQPEHTGLSPRAPLVCILPRPSNDASWGSKAHGASRAGAWGICTPCLVSPARGRGGADIVRVGVWRGTRTKRGGRIQRVIFPQGNSETRPSSFSAPFCFESFGVELAPVSTVYIRNSIHTCGPSFIA